MIQSQDNTVTFIVSDKGEYLFPYKFFKPEDLTVFLGQKELVRGIDWSVEDRADFSDGAKIFLKSGTVNTQNPIGQKLVIQRLLPVTQDTSLPTNGKINSATLEAQLDKIIMICQQYKEELSRCVKMAATDGQKPEEIIAFLLGAKDMALTAAEAAADANASASSAALTVSTIWSEITGNDASAQEALEALKQAFEAAGSIEAAAAAGRASVNEASMAALEYAQGQIEESKEASLSVLTATTQSRKQELLALISETVGAEGAVAAAVNAAREAAEKAEISADSIEVETQEALASINAAVGVADTKRQEAQAAAKEAEEQAKQAGDSAAESYGYIAQTLANKNASAQSAQSAAQSAASAELSANAAAAAAGEAATTAAQKSITAHNVNSLAHKDVFAKYVPLAGGTVTGTLNVKNDQSIKQTFDNGILRICAGTSDGSPGAVFFGKGHGSMPGQFYVRSYTADGRTSADLIGNATAGTLTWTGLNIVRSVNGVFADAAGALAIKCISNPTSLPSNANLNSYNYSAMGFYHAASDAIAKTIANRPCDNAFALEVFCGHSSITYQRATRYSNNDMWVRRVYNGTWSAWKKIFTFDGDTPSWDGKDITLGYPNYSAGVSGGKSKTYTVPQDGWVLMSFEPSGSSYVSFYINGALVGVCTHDHRSSVFVPVKKGDVATAGRDVTFIFYPNR